MHVVCYGQGIYLLVADTTEVAAQLAELGQANVSFVICENAIRSNKITLGDLVTGTVVVPSGLVEIILKTEAVRSEERRVGKESVSKCRCGWQPDLSKKQRNKNQ